MTTLAEYADINPSSDPIDRDSDELVAFVPMAAVSEDGRLLEVQRRRLIDVAKGYTAFRRGDVLMAKITPCMENGKVVHVDSLETPRGFGSTEFHVLRAKRGVEPRFVFHLVWDKTFRAEAAKHMTGSAGQKRVPANYLKNARVPLVPGHEQRRIADILDKADAIRRKRKEAIALTEELLRSAFLDMFGDPVANPLGWTRESIGDLCERGAQLVDGPFGSSLKPEHYTSGGVKVVRNWNIHDDWFDDGEFKFISSEKFEEVRRSEVRARDILITTKGTVGDVCIAPDLGGPAVLSASGTARLRLPADGRLLPEFVVAQMITRSFKPYLHGFEAGSAQQYLNLTAIKKMRLVRPPLAMQQEYVSFRRGVLALRAHAQGALQRAGVLFEALSARNLVADPDRMEGSC